MARTATKANNNTDKENQTPEIDTDMPGDSENSSPQPRFTASQKGKARAGKGSTQANAMDIDSGSDSDDIQVSPVKATPNRSQKQIPPEPENLYDPDQNLDERRELRKNLRGLHVEAQEMQTNIAETTTQDIGGNIEKLELQYKRIRAPQEAALESGILVITAETAAAKARSLRIDKDAFDTDEFISRLKAFLQPQRGRARDSDAEDPENGSQALNKEQIKVDGWHRMGALAAQHSYRIPTCDFMLGPLAIQPKEKKKRKTADKKGTGAQAEASQNARRHEGEVAQLNEAEIAKDAESTVNMAGEIDHLLQATLDRRGVTGINFFELVINPASFSQTVENMFYLSFLVRDGRVGLVLDSDEAPGEPMIMATEPATATERETAEKSGTPFSRKQLMLEMDMEMWRDAIEIYGITESLIPHREIIERNANEKW